MRSRELVSLDIDGVCARTNERMADEIAWALGMDFRFEDICDWNLRSLLVQWGMVEETADNIFALYSDPNFFKNLEPYLSAQTAVLLLRALGYDLAMNSSRPKSCEQATRTWASKHFPIVPSSRVNVFGSSEKVASIVDSGAVFHIDDHDGTVARVNSYGATRAMMLIRPWNRTGAVPSENELEHGWLDFLRLALLYRLGLFKVSQEAGR